MFESLDQMLAAIICGIYRKPGIPAAEFGFFEASALAEFVVKDELDAFHQRVMELELYIPAGSVYVGLSDQFVFTILRSTLENHQQLLLIGK